MADPAITALTVDVWTKVATAVAAGQVHILETAGSEGESLIYLQTYRTTGGTAPTLKTEGIPLNKLSTPIESSFSIDVYIMATGADGTVRVDV